MNIKKIICGLIVVLLYCSSTGLYAQENIALGGVASASSQLSGYEAFRVIDGSVNSGWASDAGFPQSITIQLADVYSVSGIEINSVVNSLESYEVEYWNGVSWMGLLTGGGSNTIYTHAFSAVVTDQIRVTILDMAGSLYSNRAVIREIELYGQTGQATISDVALNKPVSASSVRSSSRAAEYAVDGDSDTRWESQVSEPHELIVDLEGQFVIDRVVLNTYHAISGFTIDIWDESSWVNVVEENLNSADPYEATFDPVVGSQARLTILNTGQNNSRARVFDFEVYGEPYTEPIDDPAEEPNGQWLYDAANNYLYTNSGTSAGINMDDPQYDLDVYGTVNANEFLIDGVAPQSGSWEENNDIIHYSNGNIGIGTSIPSHKLTVNGEIHSKKLVVDSNVPGPDYVFEVDYQLPSLDFIRSFIEKNGHLPYFPSAQEMAENGIDLESFQMALLRTIEEIALRQIDLQKEADSLISEHKRLRILLEE